MKPAPLLGRRIREGDVGPYCPRCGSSFVTHFIFFRSTRCINPECSNAEVFRAPIDENGLRHAGQSQARLIKTVRKALELGMGVEPIHGSGIVLRVDDRRSEKFDNVDEFEDFVDGYEAGWRAALSMK